MEKYVICQGLNSLLSNCDTLYIHRKSVVDTVDVNWNINLLKCVAMNNKNEREHFFLKY
jgi:hypothetical protein